MMLAALGQNSALLMSNLENLNSSHDHVEAELEQVNSALSQVALPCLVFPLQPKKQTWETSFSSSTSWHIWPLHAVKPMCQWYCANLSVTVICHWPCKCDIYLGLRSAIARHLSTAAILSHRYIRSACIPSTSDWPYSSV